MLALASQSQLDLAHYYLQKILLSSVYDVAKVTPLSSLNKLSARLGCQVFLKREDMQPVHSFKLRGAYNRIAELSQEECQRGVVCASAGNHAQGVAMSASARGVSAVIVMPQTTPDIKVDAVRRLGGTVVLYGQSFDMANEHAQQLARDEGRIYVAPFDDEAVIAGQGTVAQEMLQQQRDLEVVFVPVGGGGLIAGIAAYYKAVMPQVKIIGVEPEDSACLKAALEADERVVLSQVGLFADGVAVKQIGAEPFRLAREYVDQVVTVTSDEICAAVKDIFEDTRAIAEPAAEPRKWLVLDELTPSAEPGLAADLTLAYAEQYKADSVLVIAHMPLLGYMVSELVPGIEPPLFATSGVTLIDRHGERGSLSWQHTPHTVS